MERIRDSFARHGLFDQQTGNVEQPDAAAHPIALIDKWYASFTDTAYRLNEGNLTEAENMMDCSVYMWYYRMKNKIAYIDWHNKRLEEQTKKK